MIKDSAVALHNQYVPFRNPTVPFPAESVAFWSVLLSLQKKHGPKGDILELGVEHGGTAFLAALALNAGEKLYLVDLKRSPMFSAMEEKLPEVVRKQIEFHECATSSKKVDHLAQKRYRFVHIDAGHLYDAVKQDLERFAHCLLPNGIVCFDDVFEIRWPGVTEAVLDFLPKSDLAPVAFVNRKLYCARKQDAKGLIELLLANLDALKAFGEFRHWREAMRSGETVVVKLTPTPKVSKAQLETV